METYDRIRLVETNRSKELVEGRAAVDALHRKVSTWAGHLDAGKSILGFDKRTYGDRPEVADDVISDAQSLLQVVQDHMDANSESLPQGPDLISDVSAALETARKEWLEAEGLKSEYQELVEDNRTNAQRFSDYLVAFRQSLASELGRQHPDFQALRAAKISRNVLEDGEAEDLPPSLIPPAATPPAAPAQAEEVPAE